MENLDQLQKDIEEIKERNKRVEKYIICQKLWIKNK